MQQSPLKSKMNCSSYFVSIGAVTQVSGVALEGKGQVWGGARGVTGCE